MAHSVLSGSAPEYVGATLDGLEVTVTDDDDPGVTLSASSLTVAEGATNTYTVELSVVPTGDVTVSVTGGGDVGVDPTSLTFSTSSWNTAQTVTVTAEHDDDAADDTQTVAHAVVAGGATEYDGATLDGVTVTVTDDDDPVVTVSLRVTGFDLHSSNDNPKGIWGNDETFWVSQSGTGKLFAYNRSDGSRDSSKDFNLAAAQNDSPTGVCSDGTTMFVVDWADNKVYAYDLATRARDSTKEFNLAATNTKSEGLWCNGDTVWVAEDDFTGSNDIFAYNRADGTANTDVDFPALDPNVNGSPLNANPRGIWSNGTTMFVVDDEDARVYAWKMSDQTRDSAKEISLDAANADPEGLWFDGRVLWVIDDADDRGLRL